MSQQLAVEVFRRAGDSIEVGAPPLADIVARAGERRHRRRHGIVAGLVVATLVVGVGVWAAASRSGSDDLGAVTVKRSLNPAGVAWYADGWLHLDSVAVALPSVTAVTELNGGAVYADADGTVAFVAADGDRRRLGHQLPGTPLVSSRDVGWAAWLDSEDGTTLVAYDVSTGDVLATRPVAPGTRLVAIDQAEVYYEDDGGAFAWTPGAADPERLPRPGLVDVQSATRVYQRGPRVDMVQSFFSVHFVRPGVGGLLSDDARYLLTRSPADGSAPQQPFRPLLYDTTSGDRLASGVAADERVVDAAFADDQTVTYLVARTTGGDPDRRPLVLRTCSVGVSCHDSGSVSADAGPLLAR